MFTKLKHSSIVFVVQKTKQEREVIAMALDEIEFDYSKLRGRIREVLGTQDKYAEELHIGRVSLSQRMNGKIEFSQNEMMRSCKILGFSPEDIPSYFFTQKV